MDQVIVERSKSMTLKPNTTVAFALSLVLITICTATAQAQTGKPTGKKASKPTAKTTADKIIVNACLDCNGAGKLQGKCSMCGGGLWIPNPSYGTQNGIMKNQRMMPCWRCSANSNFRELYECNTCEGTGSRNRALALAAAQRGQQFIDAEKYTEAEKEYRESLRLYPDSSSALKGLGLVLYRQGKFNQAEPLFKRAIALDPKNAWAYINLGATYTMLKRFEDAEKIYLKADSMGITEDALYENITKLWFFNIKKYNDALRMYEWFIKKNPYDYYALNQSGLCFLNLDKFVDAEERFRKVIASNFYKDEYQGIIYSNLANALLKQERRNEAIEAAKKSRELGFKGDGIALKALKL